MSETYAQITARHGEECARLVRGGNATSREIMELLVRHANETAGSFRECSAALEHERRKVAALVGNIDTLGSCRSCPARRRGCGSECAKAIGAWAKAAGCCSSCLTWAPILAEGDPPRPTGMGICEADSGPFRHAQTRGWTWCRAYAANDDARKAEGGAK